MPPQEKTTARASRFPHHKSRSAFAFLMTALLLGPIPFNEFWKKRSLLP